MKTFINDMTEVPKSLDHLNRHICIFDGFDIPRYILPENNEAGELGVKDWGNSWDAPQFVSRGTGELTENEFYSILVVPVNSDINVAGSPLYGNPTFASYPVEATGATDSIIFTIPTDHEQYTTSEVGESTATAEGSMTNSDLEEPWIVDSWTDYYIRNVETGRVGLISSNTADTIVSEDIDFTSGDRYTIDSKFVNARLIYSSQGTTIGECASGDFRLNGVISDMTTDTYELSIHLLAAEIVNANYFQPPPAFACRSIRGILFAGGGIEETRGKALIETVEQEGVTSALEDSGATVTAMRITDNTQSFGDLTGKLLITDTNESGAITSNDTDTITPGVVGGAGFKAEAGYRVLDLSDTPETLEVTVALDADAITQIPATESAEFSFVPSLVGTDTVVHADTSGDGDITGEALNVETDTVSFAAAQGDPDYTSSDVGSEDGNFIGCPNLSGAAMTTFNALYTTAVSNRVYAYTSASSASYLYSSGNTHFFGGTSSATFSISSGSGGYSYGASDDYENYLKPGCYVVQGGVWYKVTESTTSTNFTYFSVDTGSLDIGSSITAYTRLSVSSSSTILARGSNPHAALYVVSGVNSGSATTSETVTMTQGELVKFYVMNTNISSVAGVGDFIISNGNTKIRATDTGSNYLDYASVYSSVAADASCGLYPALFADNEAVGLQAFVGSTFIGTVTANGDGLVLIPTHGLSDGASVDFYISGAAEDSLIGWMLTDASKTPIGLITENTESEFTVASHGLSVGDAFHLYGGTMVVDAFSDYVLNVGASVKGKVVSNTGNTFTLDRVHDIEVTDSVDAFSGNMTADEFQGAMIVIGGTLTARVESNSASTLYLNADHGLEVGDSFDVYLPEIEGTVTNPTHFQFTSGLPWDVDGLAGMLVRFDPTGTPEDKLIKSNTADTIHLVDAAYETAAVVDFEIYSGLLSVSISYIWTDEEYNEALGVRYSGLDGIQLVPDSVYAGDLVSITGTGEAGNDVEDVTILRIAPDRSWFEINNDDAVAGDADTSTVVTFKQNHVIGIVDGADKTYFSAGMVGGSITMATDSALAPYTIQWVDAVNQRMGLQKTYLGNNDGTPADFIVSTVWGLYYSDQNNPHRFRAENVTDMSDNIRNIEYAGDYLLLFCENSLWKIPYASLGDQPELISEKVRCPAPGSVVVGESTIVFYDGTGFSVTNGSSVTSLTAYRARDYVTEINRDREDQIVGVYNRYERRFEFYYPSGTSTTNNRSLFIGEDSLNCYPGQVADVHAVWAELEDGRDRIYSGSSEQADGTGLIYTMQSVNDVASSMHTVASYSGLVAVLDGSEPAPASGDTTSVLIYRSVDGEYEYANGTYLDGSITFDRNVQLEAGDKVGYGYAGFSFGPKWDDFSSVQYQHRVRNIHIDLEDYTGELIVEHFKNLIEEVVETDVFTLDPSQTKVVVPFRGGKGYAYGFRLRGVSSTEFSIHSIEVLFDTRA